MAFLDQLPLDILLAVVKWFKRDNWDKLEFCKLLPVTSVNTSLRQSLIPLLYRNLAFETLVTENRYGELRMAESNGLPKPTIRTRHNAALANSAGCSEYVRRVSLFTNQHTNPDDIIRAVRDDMDAGSKTKWPNLDSYTYTYRNMMLGSSDRISWLDIIKQLDKELPRLRHASSAACEVSSGILPLTYNPPSVSFSTQITSLHLDCYYQDTETSRLPQIFAPTLVDLTLTDTNPENIWNIFCDGQESHTVVFARLTRLDIWFTSPLYWGDYVSLPPHLQGATSGMLTKRSVWTAGAASGRSGCRVPLFPVLRALRCKDMVYDFHDFISRTQCHDSLESLCVSNGEVYFDFDAELFKTLESVEFDARFPGKNEESTGSVDLYKSAFTSLLRAKTDMQRMLFSLTVRDTLFQVPPDIGCANLRSLFLGVEVDFKSMLRLLSKLKNLVELRLNINGVSTYRYGGGQVDTAEYFDELLPFQADYPPVSSTLRRFTCHMYSPRGHHCYTASYALELALHLPVLERMTLSVDDEGHVGLFEALLDRFVQELSGSPYMNDGLLNAKVTPRYLLSWHKNYWLW